MLASISDGQMQAAIRFKSRLEYFW